MNGDWRAVLVRVYGPLGILTVLCTVAIGTIWNTQIAPELDASRQFNQTLRDQIPQQTKVLEEIRDLAEVAPSMNGKAHAAQEAAHAEQTEALRKLCDAVKELKDDGG